MKQTMQGPLLVLLVNYFSYVSGTLLGSLQQAIQAPVNASDFGNIRLGQICETSTDCRSECCLFNKTAGAFTCQRLNQRYSNCSPWRPKILKGTFLDVYLHHCPCKHHMRCAREKSWHVCLKKKPHLPETKPPQRPGDGGGKPPQQEKPPVKPPGKPPVKPPVWPNGTLGLGEACTTSVDCISECCVYNPRVGFSYCHKLEQMYDDCAPWHPEDERGTLIDVYFRHCPCESHLRCTKQKKWHVCRKKKPTFGTVKPPQQAPVQRPVMEKPELGAQVVEVTAVGEAEVHQQKPENEMQHPLDQTTVQQPQIPVRPPKPPLVSQEPVHQSPQQQPQIDATVQKPLPVPQKPLKHPLLQKPAGRKPEKPVQSTDNIMQPSLQEPSPQTAVGGHQTLELDVEK